MPRLAEALDLTPPELATLAPCRGPGSLDWRPNLRGQRQYDRHNLICADLAVARAAEGWRTLGEAWGRFDLICHDPLMGAGGPDLELIGENETVCIELTASMGQSLSAKFNRWARVLRHPGTERVHVVWLAAARTVEGIPERLARPVPRSVRASIGRSPRLAGLPGLPGRLARSPARRRSPMTGCGPTWTASARPSGFPAPAHGRGRAYSWAIPSRSSGGTPPAIWSRRPTRSSLIAVSRPSYAPGTEACVASARDGGRWTSHSGTNGLRRSSPPAWMPWPCPPPCPRVLKPAWTPRLRLSLACGFRGRLGRRRRFGVVRASGGVPSPKGQLDGAMVADGQGGQPATGVVVAVGGQRGRGPDITA